MSDSFEQAPPSATAERVGDIEVKLFSPDPQGRHAAEGMWGRVRVQVVYTDGSVREIQVNLARHVSANALQQLVTLLNNLRTKGTNEIIPA